MTPENMQSVEEKSRLIADELMREMLEILNSQRLFRPRISVDVSCWDIKVTMDFGNDYMDAYTFYLEIGREGIDTMAKRMIEEIFNHYITACRFNANTACAVLRELHPLLQIQPTDEPASKGPLPNLP